MTPLQLRTWRTTNAYSQQALAKRLGVSRCTLNRWEKGKQRIPGMVDIVLKQTKQIKARK